MSASTHLCRRANKLLELVDHDAGACRVCNGQAHLAHLKYLKRHREQKEEERQARFVHSAGRDGDRRRITWQAGLKEHKQRGRERGTEGGRRCACVPVYIIVFDLSVRVLPIVSAYTHVT